LSNGQSTPTGADNPLTKDVSTGHDNPVQTAPFSVIHVKAGDKDKEGKWDVTKGPLSVEYRISDQNSMAKSGRIVYFVKRKAGSGTGASIIETIVYKQALKPGEIKPGKNHTTKHWDGKISEGLTDRIGQKVTADLSPVGIRVEIWDQTTAAPGKPLGGGKTDVPGEYLSTKETQVLIDVIAEAKWANHRCIPYGDPDEPKLGTTSMKIRVNVAEGALVKIAVCRIVDINDPTKDELYGRTPKDEEIERLKPEDLQSGLHGAMVNKDGRVLLRKGTEPYVEWKYYKEHWKNEGENNFYCFYIALGEDGKYIPASERDYVNKEKECLHMRFTVFILCPDPNLNNSRGEAKRLHSFFRAKTKYFRSYLLTKSPDSVEHFIKLFRHRYIVIILGHAACFCFHPNHLKRKIKKKIEKKLVELEMWIEVPREKFNPDQDKCPKDLNPSDIKKIEKIKFYGCGNRPEIQHVLQLGKVGKRKMGMVIFPDLKKQPGLFAALVKEKPTDPSVVKKLTPEDYPRLMFYAASCRSILTTRLAEEFTKKAKTKYYVGITYSGWDSANLCEKFFEQWIKGTKKEPVPTEYDVSRLVDCFVDAAKRKIYACEHPRITNHSLGLCATGPKATTTGQAGDAGKALE